MTENYKVLALKYRPQTFEEVIGQDVLVKTLTNSILNNKIHHAFILTGIRGVGKTTTARLIAKSLNCIGEDGNGKETIKPCLKCHHCIDIANGVDQDVIEFDAASNTGVDAIRDIIDNVSYAPINARYKIYIIDEVHMLSTSAFNALLKTLEEPPPYVKFIFATTEIRKVPITILSRCIRFDLNRIPSDVLADHLLDISKKEGFELQGKSANIIANSADGSVRDSLSLLDRIIAFNNSSNIITEDTVINILGLGGKEKIYELYTLLIKKDVNSLLKTFNEIYLNIVSFDIFLSDLLNITHMLLLSKSGYKDSDLSSFQEEWLKDNEKNITMSALFRIWQFLIKATNEIKFINNYKSYLEVLLLKISYGIDIPEIKDIIKKLQNNSEVVNSKKDDLTNLVLNTFDGAKII